MLTGVVTDISGIFPDNFFHTGGDEVVFGCWQENTTVTDWMKSHGISVRYFFELLRIITYPKLLAALLTPQSTVALEAYFEKQLHSIVAAQSRTMVVWQEIFQNGNVPSGPFPLYGSDLASVRLTQTMQATPLWRCGRPAMCCSR